MSTKKKSLFDHIKEVTSVQKSNYWETLSDDDKKTWNNYMIHRFLSMKMEWVELVNELQKYNLQPKELYKLYTNVLPKGKQWLKYIKRRNQMEHPNWLINIVANDMEIGRTTNININTQIIPPQPRGLNSPQETSAARSGKRTVMAS